MKNSFEFKKFMKKILLVSFCLVIIFLIINIYEYREYTKNFNNKITVIVNSLINKYPNLKEEEIIDILNREDKEVDILKKYGININNKSIVKENDKKFYTYLIFNISILGSFLVILIMLFIMYLRIRYKSISDITKYIEELNKKNYSLRIDSNSEDELSILKNEIYKTTVMLRETRDISIKDKENLKKALEDISHQLKTPITSILIMLDNLIDDENMSDKTRKEFIRDIKTNVTNINFLVQSILKLSKFDSNTITFIKESIFIKDIVNMASKNVATLCDLKNIKLNIKGNVNARIDCDFRWQVEAITNILKNCVEYSELDSKIDIFYEQNNVYAMIIIKDYGVGIEEDDIPYIFERFYKGKSSARDSIGIGLALSKAIIENDKGVINVKKETLGTKFIIKYFTNSI